MFIVTSHTSPIRHPIDDPIHFITQFFIPANAERYAEIKLALRLNVDHVDTITLLNERIYSDEELGISSSKITQHVIGNRLRFSDVWARRLHGYTVLANADIYLDETITRIRTSDLHMRRSMYALLRYESNVIFGPRTDSQDTWILHSNSSLTDKEISAFRFELGRPGCDNKVCYLFSILGF